MSKIYGEYRFTLFKAAYLLCAGISAIAPRRRKLNCGIWIPTKTANWTHIIMHHVCKIQRLSVAQLVKTSVITKNIHQSLARSSAFSVSKHYVFILFIKGEKRPIDHHLLTSCLYFLQKCYVAKMPVVTLFSH